MKIRDRVFNVFELVVPECFVCKFDVLSTGYTSVFTVPEKLKK